MAEKRLPTSIATTDEQSVTVRGADLTRELMGELDFGEFFYFHLTGERPDPSESRLFNALIVSIAEHGITPSVIATRLTYDAAPEAMQGAVASGLLGAGDTFLGSMENVSVLVRDGVARIEAGESRDSVAREVVETTDRLPGFGHPEHDPTDPRTDRLFELLEEEGFDGPHYAFILAVRDAVEEAYGRRLPINVTGGIGVSVVELGLDPAVARGIAIVARAAGLVGHINEEVKRPIGRDIWSVVLDEVAYDGPE